MRSMKLCAYPSMPSLPGLTPQVGYTRLAAHKSAQLGQARVAMQSTLFVKSFREEDGCAGHKRDFRSSGMAMRGPPGVNLEITGGEKRSKTWPRCFPICEAQK